jgi:hypothetical protein
MANLNQTARFLIFTALIFQGMFLLNNEKAPEKVAKNLLGMIARRQPDLEGWERVADFSAWIVNFCALANLMAVACLFSTKANCMISLNIVSVLLVTWLLYNPFFCSCPVGKQNLKWKALRNLALVGGLMHAKQ